MAGRADVPNVYADEARSRIGAEFVTRSLTDEDSERRRVAARPWPVLEPTATPLLYTAFRPLTSGSYEAAHFAFRRLGLTACAAGLLVMAHLVGHGPAAALLLLAFVAYSFQPLNADIRVGNVNQIQVGVIGAYLWLSSRDDVSRAQIAAGVLLALLVLFKPNLLPVLPVLAACWALRGRRRKLARQAAGLALGAVLGALLPVLAFGGLAAWRDWLVYLTALPAEKIPLQFGNMGLSRLLFETLGVDLSPLLATAFLTALLGCVWLGRKRGVGAPAPPAAIEDTTAMAGHARVPALGADGLAALHAARAPGGAAPATPAPPLAAPAGPPAALVVIAVDPLAMALGIRSLQHQAIVTSMALLSLFACFASRSRGGGRFRILSRRRRSRSACARRGTPGTAASRSSTVLVRTASDAAEVAGIHHQVRHGEPGLGPVAGLEVVSHQDQEHAAARVGAEPAHALVQALLARGARRRGVATTRSYTPCSMSRDPSSALSRLST